VATVVSFHAHPDDESIHVGGTLTKASRDGHRVVLVFATRGEHGEVDDGFLAEGETLAQRREAEVARSAEILGAHRVAFLGYHDSGMEGTPENDAPEAFWQAPVEEAAARLAELLVEEHADVLTIYDDHGSYGHPDHVQVHRVGVRAAELAGTPRVAEATMNRDHIRRLQSTIRELAAEGEELPEGTSEVDAPDVTASDTFGSAEAEITTRVDVRGFLAEKRASMAAHASQIGESSFFLRLPDDAFARAFGDEWFIRHDVEPGGEMGDDLLEGL
jgi:LmbE family N-acetylglucosaminyl deacetylase